jgi:cytochrome c-type biogenesis protein CcmH
MIIFWLVCSILLIIALAFLLPTLLQPVDEKDTTGVEKANLSVYRDRLAELEADLRNGIVSQEQYEQDREELERGLLEDVSTTNEAARHPQASLNGRGLAYGLALGIPVIAIVFYLQVGNPNALSAQSQNTKTVRDASATQSGDMTKERIDANVASLAKRLEQNPGDSQGWIMLARSYSLLERYSEAITAYAKATALVSDDADMWADYAFALAMVNGQRLEGKAVELVNKALELDPNNPKALELAGSAAFEARNYKQAIDYWERLEKRLPANSEVAQAVAERINEAKNLSGNSGPRQR